MQTTFRERQTQKDILLWASSYRLAGLAALVLLVLLIANTMITSCKSVHIGEPERINPNTAPLASLVRLPGIGKARAMDIIHFRQANEEPVFKTAEDMEQIKGIGPKTAEKISPWLIFEESKTD
mgnify:CR=1 FL=1